MSAQMIIDLPDKKNASSVVQAVEAYKSKLRVGIRLEQAFSLV